VISQAIRKPAALCPYDFTWARRIRHAFRLIVALCFAFTSALWFSESYLRYDRSETQYRMALTLHPAQARPILRTVVRRETEQNELPPARYVEALAQVEEPDRALENYELAYKANPRNASLIINYGCALYQDGQFEEARERFREAGVNPPRNILPRYLEAAALAASLTDDADLSDVIALLTRANTSEDPVLFPEPLWHETLPTQGQRYLEQRREIAQRMVTPIAQCAATVCDRAQLHISQGDIRDWDAWLTTIALMGDRLAGNNPDDSHPTIPQMVAALEIQRDATKLRAAISELTGGVVNAALTDALLRLDEAIDALHDFDATYHKQLTLQSSRLFQPIELLVLTTFAFLLLYATGWFLHYLGAGGKSARAVPHLWIGRIVPVLGLSGMLGILLALMVAHNTSSYSTWERDISAFWHWALGLLLCFGIVYPPLLAKMRRMFDRIAECDEDGAAKQPSSASRIRLPLRRYIGIYGCLLRRYAGVLLGGLVITVCVWMLTYRIASGLYPFQMSLIPCGVGMETNLLIEEVRHYLATP